MGERPDGLLRTVLTLYQDPDKPRRRPSLVEDLVKLPTKPTGQPLENQATAVLAWLIDHSPSFARGFVSLIAPEVDLPNGRIGARTWVSLRMPDGGTLFPDLSIDGPHGTFQFLIEVKVASDLATYVDARGIERMQDAQYRWGWNALESPPQRLRMVTTLTRGREREDRSDEHRSAVAVGYGERLTWTQVAHLLHRLEPDLESYVALVAFSFSQLILKRIAITQLSTAQMKEWLLRHTRVVEQVVGGVSAQVAHASIIGTKGAGFVGQRIVIEDVRGAPLRLRIYATPAGGPQNLPGGPDAVIVGIERDAGGKLEADIAGDFVEAGFLRERDIAGHLMHRRVWAMEDVESDASGVVSEIVEAVIASGHVRRSASSSMFLTREEFDSWVPLGKWPIDASKVRPATEMGEPSD